MTNMPFNHMTLNYLFCNSSTIESMQLRLVRFARFYRMPGIVRIAVKRFQNNQWPITVRCQTGLKLTPANIYIHVQKRLRTRD